MKISGAEIVIKCLEQKGIETVTGIPGGSNLKLYDELHKSSIKHILSRHEQGAAFIAQGMARTTGKPAVCFATSGPGATNLITAMADAKLDSVPIIAITGQVSRGLIGTDAFQEVDIVSIASPVTKETFFIEKVEDIEPALNKAFSCAAEGRPGPVLIDIPRDLLNETARYSGTAAEPGTETSETSQELTAPFGKASEMINSSIRPVIYAGGGTIHSGAQEHLRLFAEKYSIPVATSLMGLAAFPRKHDLSLGLIGMHGNKSTNTILEEADLVLCLGTRFGDRTTGPKETFMKGAGIIHIDIDRKEFGKLFAPDVAIECDIKKALKQLDTSMETWDRHEWLNRINSLKKTDTAPLNRTLNHPATIIERIASVIDEDAIITTDVGQHQMWVATKFPFTGKNRLLTSGGLGTMGFGLPAAIGAAIENPTKEVVCFSGDGSILMNIQELATLADHNLNIKIILFNNRELGLVRQQQELFYNQHYSASKFITSPDFNALARSFGINSAEYDDLKNCDDLYMALKKNGTVLINCNITESINVLPMTYPGKENSQMITEIPDITIPHPFGKIKDNESGGDTGEQLIEQAL